MDNDLLGARSGFLGLLLGSLLLRLFVDPVIEATSATCDFVDVELKPRDCCGCNQGAAQQRKDRGFKDA